jgi:hypothetical protein
MSNARLLHSLETSLGLDKVVPVQYNPAKHDALFTGAWAKRLASLQPGTRVVATLESGRLQRFVVTARAVYKHPWYPGAHVLTVELTTRRGTWTLSAHHDKERCTLDMLINQNGRRRLFIDDLVPR